MFTFSAIPSGDYKLTVEHAGFKQLVRTAVHLNPGDSLALISAGFAEKERGRAIGTWSGFTSITAAIGPLFRRARETYQFLASSSNWCVSRTLPRADFIIEQGA